MKRSCLVVFGLVCGVAFSASADVGNISSQVVPSQQYVELTMEDARQIQILENDLRILDNEIKKCEKSKKGWIAGTVIGSAGVVATSAAAIAQGVQIHKTNKAIKETNDQTTNLEKELNRNKSK